MDEHLNPDPQAVVNAVESVEEHLRDGQLLVLRSTIFPGVTRMVERLVERMGKSIDVAFCPERIAEGRAMEERATLVLKSCWRRQGLGTCWTPRPCQR